MTAPLATGSGLERAIECRASNVLPRVYRPSSTDASRGTAIHGHLERLASGMTEDESILLVDEEHRAAAEAVDLPALAGDLRLTPEVALAYHLVDGTARVLGQSLERDYSSITEDEIPLTIDVAGLDGERVIVRDYKTGHARLARTRGNWQMRGAALAVARAFERDEADAQLIYLRNGEVAWRDQATFDALDLATIAAELRAARERILGDRAAYARGEHIPPTQGSWCRYCPAWQSCPAVAAIVRLAMTGETDQPVQAGDLAAALVRADEGIKALEKLKADIRATIEATGALLVTTDDDGTETWFGKHEKPGNEKLAAGVALELAAEALGVTPLELATEAATVTKAGLERAVKARAAKGQAAKKLASILDAIRARDGITRPTTESVGLYQIRPRALASGQ